MDTLPSTDTLTSTSTATQANTPTPSSTATPRVWPVPGDTDRAADETHWPALRAALEAQVTVALSTEPTWTPPADYLNKYIVRAVEMPAFDYSSTDDDGARGVRAIRAFETGVTIYYMLLRSQTRREALEQTRRGLASTSGSGADKPCRRIGRVQQLLAAQPIAGQCLLQALLHAESSSGYSDDGEAHLLRQRLRCAVMAPDSEMAAPYAMMRDNLLRLGLFVHAFCDAAQTPEAAAELERARRLVAADIEARIDKYGPRAGPTVPDAIGRYFKAVTVAALQSHAEQEARETERRRAAEDAAIAATRAYRAAQSETAAQAAAALADGVPV